MKRIVNIRSLFFAALALGLGIAIGAYTSGCRWRALLIGGCAAAPPLFLLVLFGCKRMRQAPGKRGNAAEVCARLRLPALLIGLALLAGIFLGGQAVIGFERDAVPGTEGTVSGRVMRVRSVEETSCEFWLERVTLSALGVEAELPGRTVLKVSGEWLGDAVNEGDWIVARGRLYSNPAFVSGAVDGYSYKNLLRYTAKAEAVDTDAFHGQRNFWEGLREGLRLQLYEHMAPELYGVAYGMMRGDTSYLPAAVLEDFRTAGLAHVFAVSGLHVGFLAGLLSFVLKKMNQNALVRFCALAVVLGFYAAFAGPTGSILRASVMFLTLFAARMFGRKYDALSALSLSFVLILLFRPLLLFEVGFLMSFSVMLSLILLTPVLNRLLRRAPDSRVGMSAAASLGMLPVGVGFFHTFSAVGVLVNILLLPVASVAFLTLIAASFLTFLFPFLGILLKVPEITLFLLVFCAGAAARIPYAELTVYSLGALAALYYTAMFVCSRFLLVRPKVKSVLAVMLCFVLVAGTAVREIVPSVPVRGSVTVWGNGDAKCALVEKGGEGRLFLSLSELYQCGDVTEFFYETRIRRLEGVVIASLDSDYLGTVKQLSRAVWFDTVYLPYSNAWEHAAAYQVLRNNGLRVVFLTDATSYRAGGMTFTAHVGDRQAYALEFEKFLCCARLNGARLERLRMLEGEYDVLLAENYFGALETYFSPRTWLSFQNANYVTDQNYFSTERYGRLSLAL